MDNKLQNRLKYCTSLPSPPAIAIRLLEICEQPDFEFEELCELLRNDPALSARLLRAANSPVYGYRRRATTLKDALLFLGVNGAVSLTLTFTLTSQLLRSSDLSNVYTTLWQRSALSALVATELGKRLEHRDLEELFLMALLQDIGVFALLKLEHSHYSEILRKTPSHADLPSLEIEHFGAAHPEVGSWLLHQWRVPSRITDTVSVSHKALSVGDTVPVDAGCVAFSWRIAEYMTLSQEDAEKRLQVRAWESELLGEHSNHMSSILDSLQERIPEFNQLFETDLLDMSIHESILERARELLLIRNLKIINQSEDLKARFQELELQNKELQEQETRDHLTGLHSRSALDEKLESNFQEALIGHEQISMLMVDIDNFKSLNDHHGHIAGDNALREAGRIIDNSIREFDFAARYGGDEFVILLVKTDTTVAELVAERIRTAFLNTSISCDDIQLKITVSIGIATLDAITPPNSVLQFIHEADRALYDAKQSGRNCIVSPSSKRSA